MRFLMADFGQARLSNYDQISDLKNRCCELSSVLRPEGNFHGNNYDNGEGVCRCSAKRVGF